jgi:hypothetical protein
MHFGELSMLFEVDTTQQLVHLSAIHLEMFDIWQPLILGQACF